MATTPTTKLGIPLPVAGSGEPFTVAAYNFGVSTLDGAAGATVVTSVSRPVSPWSGQVIFETDTGSSFIWDGSAWMPAGGGGSIEISATAPSSPGAGDLWWDSDNGNLYIYYDDGTSQQWVAANGPQVFVGTTAPPGYQGQLWFDSTQGKTYIYYDDGTSAQWVSAIGGSIAGTVVQVVSTTKTDTFSASVGASSFSSNVTGLEASITPRSTSSKILVSVSLVGSQSTAFGMAGFRIMRGVTALSVGDTASSRSRLTSFSGSRANETNDVASVSAEYLDSPSTASSITYGVQLFNTNSTTQTLYLNRSNADSDASNVYRTTSTITLIEVAG
jgi:hypothetical protein